MARSTTSTRRPGRTALAPVIDLLGGTITGVTVDGDDRSNVTQRQPDHRAWRTHPRLSFLFADWRPAHLYPSAATPYDDSWTSNYCLRLAREPHPSQAETVGNQASVAIDQRILVHRWVGNCGGSRRAGGILAGWPAGFVAHHRPGGTGAAGLAGGERAMNIDGPDLRIVNRRSGITHWRREVDEGHFVAGGLYRWCN